MTSDADLFADALVRSELEREAFLAAVCPDVAQRERILALLRAHERAHEVLPAPIMHRLLSEHETGIMVGRYKLLEKIGEGGCGVVWMAQQDEPVRRRVALKVIKLGMDTKEVIARFEAERQADDAVVHVGEAVVAEIEALRPAGDTSDEATVLLALACLFPYCSDGSRTSGRRYHDRPSHPAGVPR